jgi:hypothetical protein
MQWRPVAASSSRRRSPKRLATRIAAFAGLSGKATLPALTSRRLGPVTNHPKGARFTYGFTATTPKQIIS